MRLHMEEAGMDWFASSRPDPGPFTCPVCRTVVFDPNHAMFGWCDQCKASTAAQYDGPGTKVLVVGDVSGDTTWLEDQVIPYAKATGCTKIMQVGNFGLIWGEQSVHMELDELDEALNHAGLSFVFLPGNRENHPLLQRLSGAADRNEDGHSMLRPNIFYAGRVSTWSWDGVRMAAVGGAASVDRDARVPGETWWPEETLFPEEVVEAAGFGPVDILFTHDGPLNVPIGPLVPDVSAATHRGYMSQIGEALMPFLWLHGHYRTSMLYRFRHVLGSTTVRGLAHNAAELHAESMVAINLQSIRNSLTGFRYQEPEV
jgi:hypothetical protein